MSRLPDPSRYLVGGDPPAVLLTARVAALLDRMTLDRIRVANRGGDTELDETLLAVHHSAMSYQEWLSTSRTGSLEVPSVADVSPSVREQIGCVEAAGRLGVSRRQVINLADELLGLKVGGQWVFDAEAVEDLLARRRLNERH